ncbi:MAG: dihydrodipicolinate synthase family protein [Rhizobiaceae bacterium]|nr:dihydrodipicolinate synthase family protein [Rhizobiaceae bacterium]MBL4696277.1 dihydrodipicolinate synthase family protein [Rhizobiaceae bacterium]MBL4731529.1 dihydrodipicolinate synthase family protein [Rhizobiaceae bacterium]
MSTTPYTGVWPVAPTPFNDDGSLDLEGMKRVLDCMIDQGVDGICILANFSEQFLLSDEERAILTKLCLEHVDGRIPVIVTASHFSTQIVEARCREASQMGAAMIMLMPPYHGTGLRADEEGVIEHFSRAASAGGIPIMLQDAPLSGVSLSVPMMVRMAKEIPLLQYFKIEMPQTADKLRGLIEAGGDTIIGPFDGEESITLIADLNAGATGSMCSATLPEKIREVLVAHREGRKLEAIAGYEKALPLINFENRQCGWRSCKVIMKEGGVIKSETVRHPIRDLHPATRTELLELAQPLELVAMRWGK